MNNTKLSDDQIKSGVGTWSLVGALVLLAVFAYMSKFDFAHEAQDFIGLYRGLEVSIPHLNTWQYISTVINLSSVMLLFALASSVIVPKTKSYDKAAILSIFNNGPTPFYWIIIVEEIIARVFFLTVIGTWLLHAGYPTMIILLLVGNVLWSALHYFNYKDPADRKLLVVLPQFIGGLILGFIYLKYGFVIALLIHLTYDFVVLISDKKQENIGSSVINTVYWVIVFIVSLWILNSNHVDMFSILNQWFIQGDFSTKPIDNLWLMAIALMNFSSVFNIITHVLGLDRTAPVIKEAKNMTLAVTIIVLILGSIITAAVILGLNWLVGFSALLAANVALRAVIVAFIMTFLQSPKSGSAMANLWFTDIPIRMIYVFIALTFGFWECVFIFTVSSLADWFTEYLASLE